jgi:hypothetical protein
MPRSRRRGAEPTSHRGCGDRGGGLGDPHPSGTLPPVPLTSTARAAALAALDRCDDAVAQLDAGCCEPGRSPSMRRLRDTLADARRLVEEVGDDAEGGVAAISRLEDAGEQVGRLHVGCCAPDRIPLYAEILEGLMLTQRKVTGGMRLTHGGTATH